MKDCVSLEVAKKLKEAGWVQDGTEYYYGQYSGDTVLWVLRHYTDEKIWKDNSSSTVLCAPTVADLLEALSAKALFGELNWNYHGGTWGARFTMELGKHVYLMPDERQKNPADALAIIWITLKEAGLI